MRLNRRPLNDLKGLIALVNIPLYLRPLVFPKIDRSDLYDALCQQETYARLIMHVLANMALCTELVFM